MWFPFALISAVFYAMLWMFVRASRGLPSTVTTAAQLAWAPLLLLWLTRDFDFPWSERWWQWYLVFPFFLIPVALLGLTYAGQRTQVTVIKPLSSLSTIATAFIASFFYAEKFPPLGLFGLVVITAGLLLLYHGRWKEWHTPWPWITLVCVLILGCNAAVLHEVIARFPQPYAIMALAATGAFCVTAALAGRQWFTVNFNRRTIVFLLAFAGADLAQDVATIAALLHGPAAYVIAVKRTSILLAAIGSYYVLHEKEQALWKLLFSSAVVIVGVILLNIR